LLEFREIQQLTSSQPESNSYSGQFKLQTLLQQKISHWATKEPQTWNDLIQQIVAYFVLEKLGKILFKNRIYICILIFF
jgi:hypothetical protein